MRSLEALNLVPVWVNPDHMVSTARIIAAGHHLKVLGVIDGSELLGVVTAAQLAESSESAHIRELVRRPNRIVDVTMPLRQLAEAFWQDDLDHVAVVQNDRFRGILTANLLLKEMARSWDPLTGLSWSDRLREWGAENLKAGREITIIFIDLDNFGSYNKKYGHIVGDRVLQKVADLIEDKMLPERDVLVRYGGDEFAVGTLRDQISAQELARTLRESMSRIRVAGSDEPVTFSIGVQGGKRTRERENVHYAATLDNLINLASKNSMAEKAAKKASSSSYSMVPEVTVIDELSSETVSDLAEGTAEELGQSELGEEISAFADGPASVSDSELRAPDGKITIESVLADAADANSVSKVTLVSGDTAVTGVWPRKGGSVIQSVAFAAADALGQACPGVKVDVHDVKLTESDTGIRFITVIGVANVRSHQYPVGGVSTVGRNLYHTVAEATVQAYMNLVSSMKTQ